MINVNNARCLLVLEVSLVHLKHREPGHSRAANNRVAIVEHGHDVEGAYDVPPHLFFGQEVRATIPHFPQIELGERYVCAIKPIHSVL